MTVLRIAAFSHKNTGGNPAGVMICDKMPTENEMLNTAKQVGYSETAFLEQTSQGWRVRYFAPEMEVPFCGHATIAAGAAIGERFGEGRYKFILNQGKINVDVAQSEKGGFSTTLKSPETWSKLAPPEYVTQVLNAFDTRMDLDSRFPVRFAFAGAKHLIIFLKTRQNLSQMSYEFDHLKTLMQDQDLITINLLWAESDHLFHSRNPFPTGGVYEDPATGAAAAALGGYLRDIKWTGKHHFSILQGQDMGTPSLLSVEYTQTPAEGVKVSGETRMISGPE